ncbi:MAG: efflux RND transporter periplasmic adaptor subunit [Bacteroidetes bacterium]|nr:efflux RND transporter periplasmic adaptor subunit [Bacteroidota bacterium]
MQQSLSNILSVFFAAVILISFSQCKNKKGDAGNPNTKPKGLKAQGYIVNPQEFDEDIDASGSLLANEEVDVHPEINGRITSILFKEGTFVKKGQTLVILYDNDIIATIKKLEAQKALQEKLAQRQKDLLTIGGVSQQDYDATETQIASLSADIEYQQAQLRKTKIVAPFDGKIGIRQVSVGAIISPTSIIASLQQLDPLKIDFSVPDRYAKALSIGKTVQYKSDGDTNRLNGKIIAVEPAADAATRTIKVRAIVPNPSSKLTAGTFAHVHINNERINNALLIPTQSVIPTSRDKKVAVVKNGKILMTTVQLGARTVDKVLVTDGLAIGDTIVTTGMMQVKPDLEVQITKLIN